MNAYKSGLQTQRLASTKLCRYSEDQQPARVNCAACHLPGGPVGPPARWAATSNEAGGSGTEEGPRGP